MESIRVEDRCGGTVTNEVGETVKNVPGNILAQFYVWYGLLFYIYLHYGLWTKEWKINVV